MKSVIPSGGLIHRQIAGVLASPWPLRLSPCKLSRAAVTQRRGPFWGG